MFEGKVIRGDGIGKKLGFPTANLNLQVLQTGLKPGVYVAYAFLGDKKYQAALAIQDKSDKVEVHLIDYQGPDFYNQILQVEALQKVSEMGEYGSQQELIEKIASDIMKIKQILK